MQIWIVGNKRWISTVLSDSGNDWREKFEFLRMLGQLLQVVGCGAARWVAWINLIEANPIKPWTWQGRRFLKMIQFKFDVFSRTFFKSMQICWIWSIFTTSRIAVKTENLNEKSQLCTEMDEVCRHFSFFWSCWLSSWWWTRDSTESGKNSSHSQLKIGVFGFFCNYLIFFNSGFIYSSVWVIRRVSTSELLSSRQLGTKSEFEDFCMLLSWDEFIHSLVWLF